jgi:two-component system, LuxR family, sensor histidine kinase DctS
VRRRDQARQAVAPQALLDAVMPLINLQARKLFVQVQLRVAAGLPAVLCDRTMVEQVLLNLARNGMQAMDGPGIARRVLVLEVKRHPDANARQLVFCVADAGPGIAPDVAQQLFTPFFTTKAEGMGLGLSLCRTVIEQHCGNLSFGPHTPQGTVFSFTLPLA